ncbi:hypothetical protein HN615_01005 [Candidatus Woesearchaeota archaeon]|jgi:hypothetical protein|nr:hypothetical protein [Candidatus Woesearchaeota archaeon]
MLIEILLGIFIIAFSVAGYVILNLTRKTEMLETWIEDFSDRMNRAYSDMQLIDSKGVFEADDEVGEVFTQLRDITEQLNKIGLEEQESAS